MLAVTSSGPLSLAVELSLAAQGNPEPWESELHILLQDLLVLAIGCSGIGSFWLDTEPFFYFFLEAGEKGLEGDHSLPSQFAWGWRLEFLVASQC